jgi:gamma-glutamylaminecyclotransferase
MKIVVYGSLRKGLGNHRLLEGSPFLGNVLTDPSYTMIHMGGFPGVIAQGNTAIRGEMYEVDQETLQDLDRLESHPNWYCRTPTEVIDESGNRVAGEMYLLPAEWLDGRHAIIGSGDWLHRR